MPNGEFTMKIDLLSRAQLSIINKNGLRYPLAVAEKDYFLAIVLKILYGSGIGNKLVFKGGTALHHLYLDQLRFSENLDFGILEPITLEGLEKVFSEYDFLEIKKVSPSDFSLKIDRLKFEGPLGQPNSLKIDIDLTQKIIKPTRKMKYQNNYRVDVEVVSMDLTEICAEKLRAANERARYRDFYDLVMALKKHSVKPSLIVNILKKKELRKSLDKNSILENLRISQEAKNNGFENLYYREELEEEEIKVTVDKLVALIK